jgi:asparagine synthase (glutamine-hydrolysing)
MCGIAGVMRLGGPAADPEPAVVERMCDTLAHRGPDDAGIWRSPRGEIVLGHRRLSIVDLSPAGHNPMPNEDETVWITYNGEVYNHAGYRPGLEARGHRYRSQTDTETLLHLYEEHGPEFLRRLRGMFAFALWDGPRQRLLLARDRLGIKPLYYTVAGGQLVFASEIKALLAHPAVPRELDEAALAQYLTFATVPAPATLFAGIRKLPPGHRLMATPSGELTVERWWHPLKPESRYDAELASEDDTTAALRELLRSAVIEQTMADVPHGLLLSGGLDSTLILGLLTAHLPEPVRTFSIGFEGAPGFDEREYSRAAAAHFGSEHREFVLHPRDVIASVPEVVRAQDEPLSDWVSLPLRALTRGVRESGVIVVQVGEGSDELFAGYPRYLRYARMQRGAWGAWQRLPRGLRRTLGRATSAGLAPFDRLREVRDLLERASRDEPIFVTGAAAHWDTEKSRLLSPDARARLGDRARSGLVAREHFGEYHRLAPRPDILGAMAFQDLAVRLPELLLQRVDRMTMLHSIEARVPFLDHRVVEFAFQMPPAWKVRGNQGKVAVKRAARGIVPDAIIDRRKVGFDVPLAQWLREPPLRGWARETLLGSRLHRRGLLDLPRIRGLLDRHTAGRIEAGFRLWNLINLCAWYDCWIEPA